MHLKKGAAKPKKNSQHFKMPPLVSSQNVVWLVQGSEYADLDSTSVWMKQIFNESEA